MDLYYDERIECLYEQVKLEGAVLSYGSPDIQLQEPLSSAFQEAYPEINHLYVRQRVDDLFERVLAEGRADRHLVDVVYANPVVGAAIYREGLLADHHGVPVPEGYPEAFIEDWAVVSYASPKVIVWNTRAIDDAEAPREWDDFLEPEHAGCALDVGPQSFLGVMIMDRGLEATEEWLQGFLANDGVIRRGHSAPAQAIAAGEFDCAVYLFATDIERLISEGAPLSWHAPEPTPGHATTLYIYKHTQRPHAAALFMHYILGPGAQVVTTGGRLVGDPEAKLEYEALRAFTDPSSDLGQRFVLLTASAALESTSRCSS